MRLNILFVVMDLLTLLAYPILFMRSKIQQSLKLKEGVALAIHW